MPTSKKKATFQASKLIWRESVIRRKENLRRFPSCLDALYFLKYISYDEIAQNSSMISLV